jgi:hypothetical protein
MRGIRAAATGDENEIRVDWDRPIYSILMPISLTTLPYFS